MAHFDELPSGAGDEQEQRLMRDLHRMYHHEIEDAQPLAHVRRRLTESRVSMVHDPTSAPQGQDMLSMQREGPRRVKSTPASLSARKTWQQRMGIIAAGVFVTLLVGSLVVVLERARQSSSRTPERAGHVEALSSIHMLDALTGWAVTAKGQIIRTTDGGVHWKK